MEHREQSSGESRPEEAEGVLAHPERLGVPRTLDPVITMAAVQRYAESERLRSRRLLLWTSAAFCVAILLVLIAFMSIGFLVLRNSRTAADLVADVQRRASVYATGVALLTNQVADLQRSRNDTDLTVRELAEERERQRDRTESRIRDVEQQMAASRTEDAKARAALEARFRLAEAVAAARQMELATIREQYAVLSAVVTSRPLPLLPEPSAATVPLNDRHADVADEPSLASPSDLSAAIGATEEPPVEDVRPSAEDLRGEISVVTFPNGDRYEGQFSEGLFNGWGIYVYRNGDRYEGQFRDDTKHGKGIFVYHNGDHYSGEFREDMKHGRGSYVFANGDRYAGQFKDDMITGKGTMLYRNGSKYVGDFRNGLKHGNGTFVFANGDQYAGEFADDVREGKGTYAFAGGARYIGDFKQGRREGRGRYIYSGGEEYVGEFKAGMKNGVGVCTYPDGRRLKGVWKDDEFVRIADG